MSSLRSSDPTWWRNKRIKEGQFLPMLQPFLFTVDITHMRVKVAKLSYLVRWEALFSLKTSIACL